jgi:predicted acylesterase/phospholipase RssA
VIWSDLNEYHQRMQRDLVRLGQILEDRFHHITRLVTFGIALALAVMYQVNALSLWSEQLSGDPGIHLEFGQDMWAYFLAGGALQWDHIAGVFLTAILTTWVAGYFNRVLTHLFDLSSARLEVSRLAESRVVSDEETSPPCQKPIGHADKVVRIINFAGGGFNTLMQLGVAHALVVTQGRAPDAIVGMSAGAANATALADVLQAGEKEEAAFLDEHNAKGNDPAAQWSALKDAEQKKALQALRMKARVKRLRFFIDAAQRAPREILDALLPDAYQIDSHDPLRPLEQPRFSPDERSERYEATITRSGLVKLYNDILGVNFSFGTLTRFARRWLGFSAACELKDKGARRFIQVTEFLRGWILLGINIPRAAPLVPILVRPLFFKPRRAVAWTAGGLMFKFEGIRLTRQAIKNGVSFLILLAMWMGLSIAPFTIGYWIDWWGTLIMYVLPVVLWFVFRKDLSEFDRATGRARSEAIKGVLIYLAEIAMWTGVMMVVLLPSAIAVVYYLPQIVAPHGIDTLSYGLLLLIGAGGLLLLSSVLVYLAINWRWSATILGALLVSEVVWIFLSPTGALQSTVLYLTSLLSIIGLAIFILVGVVLWRSDTPYLDRLLESYSLDHSLFQTHELKTYLMELFDPDFYGHAEMDTIVEDSLDNKLQGSPRKRKPKSVGWYSSQERREPIHVGIAVADTSTGKLDVVPPEIDVIEGLLAAISVTPFFPPKMLNGRLYIDGTNVTSDPMDATFKLLRGRIHPETPVVHMYSVTPFPVSSGKLGRETGKDGYHNLVDVVIRALRLQRFRDAMLERRLTELFTRSIPAKRPEDDDPVMAQKYFRAWVTPIELDTARGLNRTIFRASAEKRRQVIREAIADGCRASLQVMIHDSIKDYLNNPGNEALSAKKRDVATSSDTPVEEKSPSHAPCWAVVQHHLKSRFKSCNIPVELAEFVLPGQHDVGPGLREICEHCTLYRRSDEETENEAVSEQQNGAEQTLRLGDWDNTGPTWPHEREYGPEVLDDDPHFERPEAEEDTEIIAALTELKNENARDPDHEWPKKRGAQPGNQRPTVSFLFSGGVFRGVYQMGVLNALNEIGLQPDVIAGASVGSITAAMIAQTFSIEDEPSQQPQEKVKRHGRIARLAAVYLAVDRLILTDRFADFIRKLTLRAADTRFSIQQADRFFRKYDYPGFREFDRNARQVLAGLERLFYVNPYQVNQLVRDFRNDDMEAALDGLRKYAQQWLNRMQVSNQILGAEPLEQLIEEYVTKGITTKNPVGVTFDDLRTASGIHFLATATNLTEGRLEIIGDKPLSSDEGAAILQEGLLTSSAFPGVFRPRWSWAVFPDGRSECQYIDGGVTDNLPIDAVSRFLARAADEKVGLINPTPEQPHLVVAVSLQVNARPSGSAERRVLQRSWPTLLKRAKELGYNKKLDSYVIAERNLRELAEHYRGEQRDITPIDIEIVAVKPEWLCGTFAFHPMLGFRRKKQAQSIAHGCASTLLRFAKIAKDNEAWLSGWGIERARVPKVHQWGEAFDALKARKRKTLGNACWLRPDVTCPFSKDALKKAEPSLTEIVIQELSEIHTECPKLEAQLQSV